MKTGRSLAGIVMMAALCGAALTTTVKASAQDTAPAASAGTASPLPVDQLVTKTVHEAWVASGRNEDKFFAMVQELTQLSAQNRGVTLPDTHEAGVQFGELVKAQARKDPDQLLYAVVDRAVRHVGKQQASAAK